MPAPCDRKYEGQPSERYCEPCGCPTCTTPTDCCAEHPSERRCGPFNGLIQHSFALRMADNRRLFHGRDTYERVAKRFSLLQSQGKAKFCVIPVGEPADQHSICEIAPQSPLIQHDLANVCPQGMTFLARDNDGKYREPVLPDAFSWAATGSEQVAPRSDEARFIFAEAEGERRVCGNDFLVKEHGCKRKADLISQVLLEVIAHRRSLLFGLALANRFVNVMLPHALLKPVPAPGGGWPYKNAECGYWILQPVVSLIRDGRDPRNFRQMYSLTLFLVPVEVEEYRAREMPECEIDRTVNAGWGLASSPSPAKVPLFDVCGPLPSYISRLARYDLAGLLCPPGTPGSCDYGRWPSLTLRKATELIAFGVALTIAQGPSDRVEPHAMRKIGKDIVTSLGSARVSSVVVVDTKLTRACINEPTAWGPPPGQLGPLMKKLARETRIPDVWKVDEHRKYRLDRPFVDNEVYAVGVLPKNRCLIITCPPCAQHERQKSGLMRAGNAAYMTIAAATAIGTLRAIDRELETMEGADPRKIAEIEGEIAVDLHEIYDLDITQEAYRNRYRLLRDRLGITRDYETLQGKMQALGRETTTRHEVKAQAQLAWLTAAIVALSLLILIVTLAK
jgi:hypothetical protein